MSDYSIIQDEDVLKRMWQDTEDFGRKKEIRAHMYKIRENRLKDFYNTGEVTSSTTIKTTKSTSKGNEMTHADSLGDHSFMSLKSKEIRDSESPTRDAYKITGVTRRQDHGWDIVESNESSNDGKSQSTTRVATTAGKQQIQGGESNFAAKAEQKTSVYQDGDDKNFVKSVGASSHNVVKQEAHGGDENSKFYSSSTTTSSSSKYSSEQKSSTGDVDIQAVPTQVIPTQAIPSHTIPGKTVVRTYTENIPNDLKNNANFIDGKTKVTTETKTLADGSTVTTTRYETIGSKSYTTSSSSSKHQASSSQQEQRSSEAHHHDSRRSSTHDDVKITRTPRIEVCNDQSTVTIANNQNISKQFDDVESRRVQDTQTRNVTITKNQEVSRQHKTDDTQTRRVQDNRSSDVNIAEVTICKEAKPIVDESTITRTVTKTTHTYGDSKPSTIEEKTTVTKTITDELPKITKTTNYIEHPIETRYTTEKVTADKFINIEREKLVDESPQQPRRQQPAKEEHPAKEQPAREQPAREQPAREQPAREQPAREQPAKEEPRYEQPERRQPIRPGKSEMDDTRSPLDGQYDTTYRTEFIPRRISVEVSPTHDAFARSLRSVSPVSSRAGSIRNLRTPSQSSLRSSPEKFIRASPEKSPKKKSPERYDTITRRTEVDSSTLTRRKKPSRSPSPTTTASEIEFLRNTEDNKSSVFKNQKITRRHTEDNVTEKRPSSLDITTTTTTTRRKKITDRSPTSPLTDFSTRRPSPTKEAKRRDSIKEQKEDVKSRKVLRRTDTYEERCKEILGIANGQPSTPRKASLPDAARGKTPSKVQEFPSQIRKSPQKEPLGPYPEKKSPEKFGSKVQEFPSQVRRSPQKEPLEPYPQKTRRPSNSPNLNEFPSQIRKSPEKQPLEPYPQKCKPKSEGPKINEFPSQIRKSPGKEPLGPYPEKERTPKYTSKIDEFPSQTRRSPGREPLEPYPEKDRAPKYTSKIDEFPSQTRKSPGREPLEPYPEKDRAPKYTSKIDEFPSQTRRSPGKEPLEPYPEKERAPKYTSKIDEFPSQTRRSPGKEPLEPYPEKERTPKYTSRIDEFPSQTRRSPGREPLEPYPEKTKPKSTGPKINEFPSQIRKSPEKEPLEPYPEKEGTPKYTCKVDEFPSQTRRSPGREPLEPYPEKEKTPRYTSKIDEFPSQSRRSPEKQPLEPYPEKTKPKSSGPNINEFSSQIRRSPEKEPLEPYPEKDRTPKYTSKINEFPSQTRRSPGREPSPERPQDRESPFEASEFPSYRRKEKSPSPFRELRKSQDRVSLDDLPTMVTETRRSVDRVSLSDLETSRHETDFIRREKYDTDITLRKSKKTKTSKVKRVENGDESSSTSEDEEEITTTEVVDVTTGEIEKTTVQKKTEKGKTTTKTTVTKDRPKTEVRSPVKKPREPEDGEDTRTTQVISITSAPSKITKSKKVEETYKTTATRVIPKPKDTTPKTEVVTVKKTFVTTAKKPMQEAPVVKKFIPTLCTKETRRTEKLLTLSPKEVTTHKIVKKDNPEKTLIRKPSGSSLKPNTGKISGVTEYTDQYSRVTKVTQKPKVTTKITVTPVISRQDEDVLTKTRVETTKKVVNGDIKRTTTQTTKKVSPATRPDTSRHVVSAIINIKPKQKPAPTPVTKTVHKTTATKLVSGSKKPTPTKKVQNGHIPSDEEETDQEELIEKTKKNVKLEKKCIATKSILIENAVADQREIIVDLKRSKSSREGTPDRICPYPVRPDDDSSTPRYPDQIVEPEEPKQRSKTITNDIIHEDIEGITSTITEIKDESLLTVNEKVSKFLSTAEQITKKPKEFKPAPKVERPILDVDDDLREDECLLSVSDKVSKFITTADELTKSKQPSRKPVQIEDVDATVDENDESLLSVSEKVSHFIATAERVKETPKAKPRSKEPSRSPSPRKEVEIKKSPSPTREPVRTEVCSRRFSDTRRDSLETTPKSSRRTSKDEPRMPLSPTERLRSTETIKKAKALFENISKEQEVLKQRDILSRPSVFEGRRQKEQEKEQEKDVRHRSKSPEKPGDEEIPHYMTPLDRTIKEQKPRQRRTDDGSDTEDEDYQHSDLGDVPHYMLPLDRTLREKSPHKESVKQIEDIMNRSTSSAHNEEVDVRTTKFGVQLRRTDSGRATTLTQRQVTSKVETEDELNIEEIYDLEYLESLLETIVGYDIRRRIRAQIRVVKKMIEERKLEIVTTKSRSPVRETKETEHIRRGSSEYKSSYSSYSERRSSETKSTTTTRRDSSVKEKSPERRQVSPERRQKSPERRQKSPERRQMSPERRQKSPERSQKSPERKPQSPERKTTKPECSKVFQTELKKTKPVTKKVIDEKPVWVTQKTLKKVTDTPVKKTVVTTTTKTSRTTSRSQKSPSKERAPTDVITSSYGVGPMDENGAPLFGLRALKAQNKSEKTKVQGTVIQSRYYSENGQEPVGEISVTKYSTDPKDLPVSDSKKDKGVSSVTTTQKFGYKGTPSLKSITSKTKGVESGSTSSTRTTKVTRRGSVKEMSQKFIENAVDSLKSERQSSYPKAGLILRTSSFKDTDVESPSSREGSPGYEETRRTVTTVKTSSSSGGKVDTFLTNKSRVTGVQDVITRMKNEETEGETAEDIEAKNLLNKFIGSQVILSGIESANKSSGGRKSVTKITTTTTTSESGKPTKTVTRTFTHPITPELLKTVWDEQTLNLLLEQSSSHDDRRHIKTRLREIMAEQEACADLVEKASEDITRQESKSSIHEKTSYEGPYTSSSQVTTRVTTQQKVTPKPMSPFAKFKQLDKQNSLNSPPSTPKTPTGSGSLFKFTDPALNQSANTIKQRLLQWCQMRTHGYENIQLDNFSTSWADGMAFCALIHRFVPDAFDYNALNPKNRRHNFTLAFKVAEDKAGIFPLLDVDDMVALSKPDWKCVFTYVQSIYRKFKDAD